MEKKISKLFFSLTFIIGSFIICQPLSAEENDKEKKTKDVDYAEIPFFKGISIGYDLMGPIYKAYSDDYMSNEISVDFNFKNRFFPVVELGYGNADKWSDKGIQYKAKAPYMRLGMDYNFFYKKKHNSMLSLGLRYAFTTFDFDVASLPLVDDQFGEQVDNPGIYDDVWQESGHFSNNKFSSNMHWVEFVASVRTKIFYNFHMGWSIRVRNKLSSKSNTNANPWYVPGYGIYKNMRFGINYSIIYTIPFGKKKK